MRVAYMSCDSYFVSVISSAASFLSKGEAALHLDGMVVDLMRRVPISWIGRDTTGLSTP